MLFYQRVNLFYEKLWKLVLYMVISIKIYIIGTKQMCTIILYKKMSTILYIFFSNVYNIIHIFL